MEYMRKRGITYLEIIIAISIISIIASISLGFYVTNYKNYLMISSDTDEDENLRIAVEYLIEEVVNSGEIELMNSFNGSYISADEINVENTSGDIKSYLLAGSNKIYIVNNIIRCNENSNHVVSGIKSFSIKRKKEKLYTITVSTDKFSAKTNVYKRV